MVLVQGANLTQFDEGLIYKINKLGGPIWDKVFTCFKIFTLSNEIK